MHTKAYKKTAKTKYPRPDTLWKKILRDVREFFRILFRVRFHPLEFKDQEGIKRCILTMFEELNISYNANKYKTYSVFNFLHQSHRKGDNFGTPSEKCPFDAIDKYNEEYKSIFMRDVLCSKMLYFVYMNFLDRYCLQVNLRFRKEVVQRLCMILNWYKRMRKEADIDKIKYHLL